MGQHFLYNVYQKVKAQKKEVAAMKGYYISDGYMGFVENGYILFASETDYYDYMEEETNDGRRTDLCAAA